MKKTRTERRLEEIEKAAPKKGKFGVKITHEPK